MEVIFSAERTNQRFVLQIYRVNPSVLRDVGEFTANLFSQRLHILNIIQRVLQEALAIAELDHKAAFCVHAGRNGTAVPIHSEFSHLYIYTQHAYIRKFFSQASNQFFDCSPLFS